MSGIYVLSLFVLSEFHFTLGGLSNSKHFKSLYEQPVRDLEDPLPLDEWFTQKVDHFDLSNSDVWWQRYYRNESWFENHRHDPIFLMIGGQREVNTKWLLSGAWLDYAKKYKALCFLLEHRFYGKSQPFEWMTVENLRYLSSEQALEDIANFIRGMNEKYQLSANNKWIVFDASYSGSLAALARLKYPHLIHAAVSSSGSFQVKANFKEYYEAVRSFLSKDSKKCADNVHLAALSVEHHLKTNEGAIMLSKKFNLCEPLSISNKKDLTVFVLGIATKIRDVVQYNNVNRITRAQNDKATTVSDICRIMVDDDMEILDRYAAVKRLLSSKCPHTSYNEDVDNLKCIAAPAFEDVRPWLYQVCTEFGLFVTSSTEKELFGSLLTLQYGFDLCKDVFGENFDYNCLNEGLKRTNKMYSQLSEVSRVIFVQGTADPLHVLGINHSTIQAPAIVIEGSAHCADFYPPSPNDSPQLVEARNQIERQIGDWLHVNLFSY